MLSLPNKMLGMVVGMVDYKMNSKYIVSGLIIVVSLLFVFNKLFTPSEGQDVTTDIYQEESARENQSDKALEEEKQLDEAQSQMPEDGLIELAQIYNDGYFIDGIYFNSLLGFEYDLHFGSEVRILNQEEIEELYEVGNAISSVAQVYESKDLFVVFSEKAKGQTGIKDNAVGVLTIVDDDFKPIDYLKTYMANLTDMAIEYKTLLEATEQTSNDANKSGYKTYEMTIEINTGIECIQQSYQLYLKNQYLIEITTTKNCQGP